MRLLPRVKYVKTQSMTVMCEYIKPEAFVQEAQQVSALRLTVCKACDNIAPCIADAAAEFERSR